ncbi:beta-amylase 2, chloroplastic-like isoform X3 [Chenopodium quinoa]|uniref:beta-amylase 2, chloroplastic-like isoform X3 n=1 Tax=Chenopodium quinoa TaxID=63459 RepID=UPI000B781392|nr:beta-amylase 2, chloroplastic-like isoform X3 [Chenopodium quinoa]XP_021716983.1 beta-amylase 2, chloroplastic-like isoform X3 [Chenopodium quinoa]
MKSLQKAAEVVGVVSWGRAPNNSDRVLAMANLAVEDFLIAAKLFGIYWWFKTASHAAEQSARYYVLSHRDGYASIAAMLKQHEAALNFTCV